MKRTFLYKSVSFVIVIFLMVQISNAAPPKGFDFTVSADAPYKPGELIVRFAPKQDGEQRSATEKNQILGSLGGGTIKSNFKIVPGLTLVELPAGVTVKDALKTFNGTNGIMHAQPNYILRAASTFPNDQHFSNLWGIHNIGQSHPVEWGGTSSGTPDADIDAPGAWDIATDSNHYCPVELN